MVLFGESMVKAILVHLLFWSCFLYGAGRIDRYNWDHDEQIYKMERNSWHVFYEREFPLEVCVRTSESWESYLRYIVYAAMRAWDLGYTRYLLKYLSPEQRKLVPIKLWTPRCGMKEHPDILIETAELSNQQIGVNIDYWAIARFFTLRTHRVQIYISADLNKQYSYWTGVNTVIHELGHALGIPHQSQGVMNYNDANNKSYAHEVDLYTITEFTEPYLEGVVKNDCSRAFPCCWKFARSGELSPICDRKWRYSRYYK